MANGSDGSLIFDTELDNEGFEKGSDKLLSSIEGLTGRIDRLASEIKQAFSGFAAILQSVGTAAQSAGSDAGTGAGRATRAAQQTAQAQSQAATATNRAATATRNYDKELARLQKQISKAQSDLTGYYQELSAVEQTTNEWMENADGPNATEQINNILEIEAAQIEAINQKYASKINILRQLEAEYAKVAAACNGAGTGASETGSAAETSAPSVNLFAQALANMVSKLREAYSPANMTARAVTSVQETLQSMGTAAARTAKLAFNSIAAGAKKAVSGLKSFVTQAKKTATQSNALAKSLTSLKRMLVTRIKRMFISAIFSSVQEGLKQLALFDSSFNERMSNIKNSMTQLSGNISVTVGNILSTLEPVITTIINLINKAVTALNQFFALLSGKRTYTVAKKGTEQYAEAAESAAAAQKEFNAELYSFDELNRQSKQDDDSGGSSVDDSAIQYEEVPIDLPEGVQDWIERLKEAWQNGDWYGVGQVIAEGLNYAIEVVDDWINNTLRPEGVKWAGRFAEIMNGLTDGIDWPMLGKTIADGCNAIADTVNTFFTTFRAKDFGAGVGEAIKSWFDAVDWSLIGQTFANGWNALLHTIEGVVTTPGIWTSIGAGIADFIRGWFENIDADSIAASLISILNGVTETVCAFLEQNPFEGMAEKVYNAINRVLHEVSWADLGRTIGKLFLEVLRTLLRIVQKMDWAQLGRSVGEFLAGIDWAGILASVATLVWEAAKAAIQSICGFLKGLGPEMILASISAVIAVIAAKIAGATLLAPIVSALGTVLTTIITGICTAIAGWPAVVIAAAAAALAALIVWIKNGGADVIAGWYEGMKDGLANVGAWIKEHIVDPFVNFFKSLFGIHSPSTVMQEMGTYVVEGFLNGISNSWNSITEFFSGAISNLTSFLSEGWSNIVSNAKSAWNNLKTNVTTAFNNAKTGLAKTATQIKNSLSDTWTNIRSSAQNAWSNIRSNVTTAFENARTTLSNTGSQIKSNLSSTWSNVYSNAQSAWSNVYSAISNAFSNARTSVLNTASNMRSNLSSAFSGIVSNANTAWSNLRTNTLNYFSNLRTNVLNAWNNLRTNMNNIQWNNVGHNLVAGLNNGVAGAWGGFMSNVSTMVNNLISRIKSLFGIHSPSKVFAEIGEFLDAGLVQGIEDGERGLLTTAKNVATAVTEGMTPDSPDVQMNVDSVVGSMQAIISSLGSLATTFQTIANALTSMGGFTMPQIAAGTVAPYQTRVAATTAPAEDSDGVTAYLLGILSELQALARSMRNGDGSGEQVIQVNVDGDELFNLVVRKHNQLAMMNGVSPFKGRFRTGVSK